MKNIKELLSLLTLEEKAGLCSGKTAWLTKNVDRLDIPSIRMSDGPHGLRCEKDGKTLPAVCFPTASMSASSFDKDLLSEMGKELGRESREVGVNVLLGPGINMKRSPLCGRNFEYFSEDPNLAGELGAAFVNGVQSQGVGTSLKHFFANSQEHKRMESTSEMDDRTAREIYLCAFETVVKKAQPWTIMASYNKIGGTYATANEKYLDDILRKEWGFEGLVVSDWGATHDRPGAVKAGTDITMPAEPTDHFIVEAVNNGSLPMEALDACCYRILSLVEKCINGMKEEPIDYDKGHALAEKVAENSMVLLKNNGILPLDRSKKILFVGGFASEPRYQGGGSSHVNSVKVVSALDAANSMGIEVGFVRGYPDQGFAGDDTLHAEAVKAASEYDVAVIFAGLPDQMESEGYDRRQMNMPFSHNKLISDICAVNPNTVVVLHNGSPVEMPWVDAPAAILESYLGGEAIGEAQIKVLFGDVCPSGHLAESFPVKLSDNPSYLYYFGEGERVEYREGVFIGYRYYTSKNIKTLFPFGHGLSYTEFEYSDLSVDKSEIDENGKVTVTVKVKNVGERTGKAVVQLYVSGPGKEIIRPARELKGFEKVELAPGETTSVSFELTRRAFAHWSNLCSDWRVEGGEYKIQICENSEKVLMEVPLKIQSLLPLRPISFSMGTTINEIAMIPEGYAIIDKNFGAMLKGLLRIGFIPGDAAGFIMSLDIEDVSIEAIKQACREKGKEAVADEGIAAIFGMSISFMSGFMTPENRAELIEFMERVSKK